MELRDYRAASADDQFSSFNPHEYAAINHVWAAMAVVHVVTMLRFGVLSGLVKLLLILPHSNTDPKLIQAEVFTKQRLNKF